jgi:transposase InsO family protein
VVDHDGGDNNGAFHYTLDATDVATGWTESITVRTKGERIVSAGLEQLRLAFPFAVLGIHSDNGSEFINHHLLRWCDTRQITFSRGRSNHSNDQAHIEQKNWSEVRRAVGYYRYDTTRELDLLNELWPLQSILDNLFLPNRNSPPRPATAPKSPKPTTRARPPTPDSPATTPTPCTPTTTPPCTPDSPKSTQPASADRSAPSKPP